MACEEIDVMRQQVMFSLRNNVNAWETNLQAQWGDPRVYQSQQQERERQDARVAYDLGRRNQHLLDEAYAKQSEDHKKRHTARLKTHPARKRGTPPESQDTSAGTRKP